MPGNQKAKEKTIVDHPIVFFRTDNQGKLLEWGGTMEAFNIRQVQAGEDIADVLLFMEGILPLDRPMLKLPCLKIQSEGSIDAYIFKIQTGHGLVLLDATQREAAISEAQQKNNEQCLQREKKARSLKLFKQQP